MTTPILSALAQRLRCLPTDNPAFPADAILIAADYIAEAAAHLTVGGQPRVADHALDVAAELRRVEAAARRLAPVFAPPAAAEAQRLAKAETALRTEGTP